MDEFDDLVERVERAGVLRVVGNERLAHALEQVQVHAPGLTLQFTGATAEVQGSTVFVRLAGEN